MLRHFTMFSLFCYLQPLSLHPPFSVPCPPSVLCRFVTLSPSFPLMRSPYLWPRKLQNHTIPVNLEAIQTTTIASKLFQPLYLGYNRVLHYIVYGLQLSNFDISLAFTSDWHPRTYPLASNISSRN